MRKKILASVFVLSMLVGTAPIFAASTSSTAALNETQLTKLNTAQTKLATIVTSVNSLLATYKNSKNKGLLISLLQIKKQAKMLSAQINQLIKHPTKNADKRIDSLVKRTTQLEKRLNLTANILNKTQNRTKTPVINKTPIKNLTSGNKTNCTSNNVTLNKTEPDYPGQPNYQGHDPWDVVIKPIEHLSNNTSST